MKFGSQGDLLTNWPNSYIIEHSCMHESKRTEKESNYDKDLLMLIFLFFCTNGCFAYFLNTIPGVSVYARFLGGLISTTPFQ